MGGTISTDVLLMLHTAIRPPSLHGTATRLYVNSYCPLELGFPADSSSCSLKSGSPGTNPFDYPEHSQFSAFFPPLPLRRCCLIAGQNRFLLQPLPPKAAGCLGCRCAAVHQLTRGSSSTPRGWVLPAFPSPRSSFSRGSCGFLRVHKSTGTAVLRWGRRPPRQLHHTGWFPCVCRGRSSLQLGRTRACCRRDQKLSAALAAAQAHTRLLPAVRAHNA